MKTENEETKEPSIADETMEMCKLLYCNKDLPMSKTCMCWGWECGKGWHDVLKRVSCELEALNLMYYDKYKVRIQADQVKEKFGTLRFYYSVVCDNYTEEGLEARKIIDAFEEKKDSGYFGIKCVVDEKGHETTEVDEDGKEHTVWHQPKCHVEITKHKDEYEQMEKAADDAQKTLSECGYYDITPEQKVIIEFLESEASARIAKAEDDCYKTCEECGRQIGTDWSPRCETTGWITYICDSCAEKRKFDYYKNGEKWNGKTRLMTAEEVKAKHEAYEKKLEEEYGEPDDEGENEDLTAEEVSEKFNKEITEAMNENKE